MKRTGLVFLFGLLLAVAVTASGASGVRLYDAKATYKCLKHRPEARTDSPAAPGLHYLEMRVRQGTRGNKPIWGHKGLHVPTLFMTFAPFRLRSTRDRFAIADASFFTDQKAASAYFQVAYHIAHEAMRFTDSGLLVQQRRNVVLEWNSPFNHDYLRVVLGCLRRA